MPTPTSFPTTRLTFTASLKIADPQIREVVENELDKGKLWPEPLLQFNPSFAMSDSLDDLVRVGTLHTEGIAPSPSVNTVVRTALSP